MTFSIKDFFSKCDRICSFLQIWSCLLKKSLIENFIFCAVFLSLLLESSTFRNIRNFFRVFFLFFEFGGSLLKSFILKVRKFHSQIYKKNLFLENIRKFRFPKYKKSFFWEKIRNFFRVGFFIIKI